MIDSNNFFMSETLLLRGSMTESLKSKGLLLGMGDYYDSPLSGTIISSVVCLKIGPELTFSNGVFSGLVRMALMFTVFST